MAVVKAEGGKIVVGTDTRVSPGERIVSNRDGEKVYAISNSCALCNIGGDGSDFNGLYRDLEALMTMGTLSELAKLPGILSSDQQVASDGERVLSARAIATYARQMVYSKYKKAHVVIAGENQHNDSGSSSGNKDAYLFEILPGGCLVEHDHFVVAGMGSRSVLGLLEKRLLGATSTTNGIPDSPTPISLAAARRAVQEALETAIELDPRCGGVPRLYMLSDLR